MPDTESCGSAKYKMVAPIDTDEVGFGGEFHAFSMICWSVSEGGAGAVDNSQY